MNWTELSNYLAANWLEVAGFITTLLGIWLTTRRLLVCWPVVLLADVLYLVVFYRARLFSDSLLQIFFVAFTLYGWWHWARGVREDGEVRVEPLSWRGWLGGLAAGAVGAVLLGWLMVRIGAALPHLDAALTSYSLVASWWGARKHTANWVLWIAVDLVYIGEYLYKGLRLTALLYLLLVALAVLGLWDWRRAARATCGGATVEPGAEVSVL
ncbi:MAG: nicotinamide riboside transporter PnuC [Terracidiphilus sp.]|nr:nicotinamide riboside transporter PnuC [Terracidiphilus sp.]MDR3777278.1 nicotinamide riboside transporter PnuC [Terracidiphilus sp.]